MRQLLSCTFLLVLLAGGIPAAAVAGDPACASTQAANDLRSCDHCREVKRILSDPAFEGVRFEVTPLRLGATIRMEADQADAQILLQEFTARMWESSEVDETEHVCDYCRKRHAQLEHVLVDWTTTANGVQLVLISEEPKFAQWALADARDTQGWVLSSAGH